MIKIGVVGTGKLGSNIMRVGLCNDKVSLASVIARPGNDFVGKDIAEIINTQNTEIIVKSNLLNSVDECDVFIDCTNVRGFFDNYDKYKQAQKPLIIGTTGFSDIELNKIQDLSKHIPIVMCHNFNIGVYKFIKTIQFVTKQLGPNMDIEIIEAHHKFKKDKPSGTAKAIKNAILQVSFDGKSIDESRINTHSLRAGDIIGVHKQEIKM